MTWLAFAFALELGLLPQGGFVMYENVPVFSVDQINVQWTVFTDLSCELQALDLLYIGGGVRIPVRFDPSSYTFDPLATYYSFKAGFRKDWFQLQYLHACFHPQMTYAYNFVTLRGWEGAYDEISLKASFKVGGHK